MNIMKLLEKIEKNEGKILASLSHDELVAISSQARKKIKGDKIYGYNFLSNHLHTMDYPFEKASYQIFGEEETREFVRRNVECYRNMMLNSNNIVDFVDQLDDYDIDIANDRFNEIDTSVENLFTDEFQMAVSSQTILSSYDEPIKTVCKMHNAGCSTKDVIKYLYSTCETCYIGLDVNIFTLEFKTNEFNKEVNDNVSVYSQLPMKYNCLEFALYDLAAFLDELDKLEFDVIFKQNGSIVIYDRNLKTNAGYMVFSKEKVK